MKGIVFALVLTLLAPSVFAAVECKSFNLDGFQEEKKASLAAKAYAIVSKAGFNDKPVSIDQDDQAGVVTSSVCFDNPSFDIDSVLTQAAIDAQYNSDTSNDVVQSAITEAVQQKRDAFMTKLWACVDSGQDVASCIGA